MEPGKSPIEVPLDPDKSVTQKGTGKKKNKTAKRRNRRAIFRLEQMSPEAITKRGENHKSPEEGGEDGMTDRSRAGNLSSSPNLSLRARRMTVGVKPAFTTSGWSGLEDGEWS